MQGMQGSAAVHVVGNVSASPGPCGPAPSGGALGRDLLLHDLSGREDRR